MDENQKNTISFEDKLAKHITNLSKRSSSTEGEVARMCDELEDVKKQVEGLVITFPASGNCCGGGGTTEPGESSCVTAAIVNPNTCVVTLNQSGTCGPVEMDLSTIVGLQGISLIENGFQVQTKNGSFPVIFPETVEVDVCDSINEFPTINNIPEELDVNLVAQIGEDATCVKVPLELALEQLEIPEQNLCDQISSLGVDVIEEGDCMIMEKKFGGSFNMVAVHTVSPNGSSKRLVFTDPSGNGLAQGICNAISNGTDLSFSITNGGTFNGTWFIPGGSIFSQNTTGCPDSVSFSFDEQFAGVVDPQGSINGFANDVRVSGSICYKAIYQEPLTEVCESLQNIEQNNAEFNPEDCFIGIKKGAGEILPSIKIEVGLTRGGIRLTLSNASLTGTDLSTLCNAVQNGEDLIFNVIAIGGIGGSYNIPVGSYSGVNALGCPNSLSLTFDGVSSEWPGEFGSAFSTITLPVTISEENCYQAQFTKFIDYVTADLDICKKFDDLNTTACLDSDQVVITRGPLVAISTMDIGVEQLGNGSINFTFDNPIGGDFSGLCTAISNGQGIAFNVLDAGPLSGSYVIPADAYTNANLNSCPNFLSFEVPDTGIITWPGELDDQQSGMQIGGCFVTTVGDMLSKAEPSVEICEALRALEPTTCSINDRIPVMKAEEPLTIPNIRFSITEEDTTIWGMAFTSEPGVSYQYLCDKIDNEEDFQFEITGSSDMDGLYVVPFGSINLANTDTSQCPDQLFFEYDSSYPGAEMPSEETGEFGINLIVGQPSTDCGTVTLGEIVDKVDICKKSHELEQSTCQFGDEVMTIRRESPVIENFYVEVKEISTSPDYVGMGMQVQGSDTLETICGWVNGGTDLCFTLENAGSISGTYTIPHDALNFDADVNSTDVVQTDNCPDQISIPFNMTHPGVVWPENFDIVNSGVNIRLGKNTEDSCVTIPMPEVILPHTIERSGFGIKYQTNKGNVKTIDLGIEPVLPVPSLFIDRIDNGTDCKTNEPEYRGFPRLMIQIESFYESFRAFNPEIWVWQEKKNHKGHSRNIDGQPKGLRGFRHGTHLDGSKFAGYKYWSGQQHGMGGEVILRETEWALPEGCMSEGQLVLDGFSPLDYYRQSPVYSQFLFPPSVVPSDFPLPDNCHGTGVQLRGAPAVHDMNSITGVFRFTVVIDNPKYLLEVAENGSSDLKRKIIGPPSEELKVKPVREYDRNDERMYITGFNYIQGYSN